MPEMNSVTTSRYVLLDTNTLWNDFYLNKQSISDLKYYAEKNNLKILVPSIVRDEVFSNFDKQWNEAVSLFTEKFIYHAESLNMDDEKDKSLAKLNLSWSNFLGNDNVELLDCSEISMKDLISRNLMRSRPFHSSGDKGFKDTLIWMSAIEHIRNIGARVELIVITHNKSDFSEKGGILASNLSLELESVNSTGLYFMEIGHFLVSESKKDGSMVKIIESLKLSMPEIIQGHFDYYDNYSGNIDSWIDTYTDIGERAFGDVVTEYTTIKFIEIKDIYTGKRPSDKKEIISGKATVVVETSCRFVVDADYESEVWEESEIKFFGFIPFTMLKKPAQEDEYDMPELEEIELTRVEDADIDGNSLNTTCLAS